jgi:hypothetical protein
VDPATIAGAVEALGSGRPSVMLIGGRVAANPELLALAGGVAAVCGARLMCETFPARLARGAGRVSVDRLSYLAEFAQMQLDGTEHLVLIDTRSPVSFFAYPDKASDLVPDGCVVHDLVPPSGDVVAALEALAGGVGAASLARAPSLVFNAKDDLQARWVRRLCHQDVELPRHAVPSAHAFVTAAVAGMGWGLHAEDLVAPHLAQGTLVELVPHTPLDVPLYWQHARAASSLIDGLSAAVVTAAGRALKPAPET